jgi:hypothetical protein
MAWTAPKTWLELETLTSADINLQVSGNITYLKARPLANAQDWDNVVMSTSSTSFVDVTGMSATVTTGASSRLLLLASGSLNISGAFSYLTFDLDGTNLGDATYGMTAPGGVTGANYSFSLMHYTAALSNASHTVKLRARVASSTLNITMAKLIIMEIA